jgi:exoribonuclease R
VRPAAGAQSLARDEVRGRLVLHHDGYGFVVPDVPMPQLDGDVFIPRDAVEDAMHGDHVLAKLQRVSDFRGACWGGRILRSWDCSGMGRGEMWCCLMTFECSMKWRFLLAKN